MVNLKTRNGTFHIKRNINLKFLLKFTQISNMRTNYIPKCHDVLIKRPLFINR